MDLSDARRLSMATVQAPVQKPAAPPKHEAFVETQLHRAVSRIRTFDALAGLFGFLIVAFVYGLGLIVLDAWLVLPSLVRQIAFGLFVLAILGYLSWVAVRLIRWRVNPYYAAVQLEHTLPGAKNSLINWLDLRDQSLPGAIRGAVGSRAAKDLSKTNIEQAITGRQVLWLGGIALILLLATAVVFAIFGPGQFASLLGRAFIPFTEATIAKRTTLTIVQPDGGNATVLNNQSVSFVVRVGGRVPNPNHADAVKLVFRYSQDEPIYQERPLLRGDSDNEWVYVFPAVEVHSGFFYKITGGDNQTDEFQIQARSSPALTGFEVHYKHRPYLRQPEEMKHDPNLVGWRGTEVMLLAKTNRVVKEGSLRLEGAKSKVVLPSERVESNEQALLFRFILAEEGAYRIRFESAEGERSGDSVPYTITVKPDVPPAVEITVPAEELRVLPANGTLQLKGKATDDYGLADLKLRLKIKDTYLQPKPYVHAQYRYEDGSFPLSHDYQDFIELEKLRQENGAAQPLKPGDIIEYWLEGTDNCDYPDPNGQLGKSKVYKIKIAEPIKNPQQEKERQQAREQQKKHDQETKQKQQKENEAKKEEAKRQQEQSNSRDQSPADKKKEKELKEQEENFKKDIEKKKGEAKQEQKPEPKGEGKNEGKNDQQNKQGGDQGKNGEAKQPKPQEGAGNQNQGQQGAGEKKPDQKPGQQQGAGESKGQGKPEPGGKPDQPKPGAEQGKGNEKGESKQPPQGGGKGAGEDHKGKPKEKAGDTKPQGGAGDKPTDKVGQGRSEGKPTGKEDKPGTGHAEGKTGAPSKDDNKPVTGEARGENPQGKGEFRGSKGDQPQGEAHKNAQGKDGPASPKGGPPAEQKPAKGSQAKDSASARGEGSPNQTGDKAKSDMDKIADLAKQLKGNDPQKKADAEQQLRQIAKEASDAKERQAAKEALDSAKNQGSSNTGDDPKDAKNQTGGNSGSKGKEDPKLPPKDGTAGQDTKTGDPKQSGKTDGKGKSTDKTSDQDKKGPGSQSKGTDPSDKAAGPAGGPGDAGNNPGGGQGTGERPANAGSSNSSEEPGKAADPAHKKRAAELQLEELMKKITPEMLKERNWTQEDLNRFYKARKEMIDQEYRRDVENLARPQVGGTNRLPGGVRTVTPGGTGTPQDLQNIGKTAPPPEFRNSYQEFTQELSKLKKK
jgi:hypothetical protein